MFGNILFVLTFYLSAPANSFFYFPVIEFPSGATSLSTCKEESKLKNKQFAQVLSVLCLLVLTATTTSCGTIGGAAIGSALGAGIDLAVGGSGIAGALIGAAVGGTIGTIVEAEYNRAIAAPYPCPVRVRPYSPPGSDILLYEDIYGRIWVWDRYGGYWKLF